MFTRIRLAAIAVGLLLCASIATATEFPSSVTGDYVGGGFMCRVVAGQFNGSRGFEVKCTQPGGEQTVGLTTTNACPSDALNFLIPLAQWGSSGAFAPGSLWVRPIAYDAESITFRLGSYGQVMTGGGNLLPLVKVRNYSAQYPYSGCNSGSAAISKPRD